MKAQIVVGLGFGDEGKGLTTDYLCYQNEKSLVVRFSGGQQCGHNVCIGDKQHVHSNFGSGTLRGLPSYFSEHTTIYPVTMATECKILRNKGIEPRLTIHPLAKVTTPFDVLANRIFEEQNNHGSCGLGVGQTMKRDLAGYKLFAFDLRQPKILREKLNEIEKYYDNIFEYTDDGKEWLKTETDNFLDALDYLTFQIADYDYLQTFPNLVFEGSQGIMLDQFHGIFPHVTYAHTTSKNALEICDKLGVKERGIFYVTRCYLTRHGYGWMPNEGKIELINTEAEINKFNDFQKNFRIGEIDYDLLNYALQADAIYSQAIEKNLVVTCLDQRAGFAFDYSKLPTNFKNIYESRSPYSEKIEQIRKI